MAHPSDRLLASGLAPSASTTRATAARALDVIHRQGDRWMAGFIAAHFLLALALAPVNDTWGAASVIGGGMAAIFAMSALWWPGTYWTRCVAGVALQAFAALHIFQMRGLEEMHFFVFTAATMMIAYQDVRSLWPAAVGLIVQHTAFTYWHNAGHPLGGVPFFAQGHVGTQKIAFHFGIAVMQVVVTSFWASALRRKTLRDAAQQEALAAANVALAEREAATARSLSLVEATLEATADGILVVAADRVVDFNQRFAEMWGMPVSLLAAGDTPAVIARCRAQLVDPDAFDARMAEVYNAPDVGHFDRIELTHGRVFERVVRPQRLGGVSVGHVLSFRDVTAQHRAQAALAASEARFRAVFDHAGLGILFCDDQGVVLETNPAVHELLGYSADELRGRASGTLSPPEEAEVTREPVRELKAGLRERVRVEKRFLRSDGTEMLGELTVSRVESDGVRGTVGMLQDVTERHALEAQLTRQALTDALTGLANRVLFHDRVRHALARASRDPGRVAVLLVDLDGFKLVNDGLGHASGDVVLTVVGERLRRAVREGDTVARLGGDEFAVLLEDVRHHDEADAAAERVLAALSAPVLIQTPAPAGSPVPTVGSEVFVGASIGIALATVDDDPESLLRNADVAMYTAKGRGKGQAVHFERSMHERALARLRLEADLRAAVAELDAIGDATPFRLLFQPIVDLATGRVSSAEALVRWAHRERGLVSPLDFISAAEDTGQIIALGRWVLHEACRQAARWPHGGDESPVGVSVNVSGRQLQEPGVVDDVREALESAGLAPHRLTLEITESVVMGDTPLMLARLRALKALGVRLAVDDFGTGYSSLSYLRQFPVDVLKIDKSFVDGVARGGDSEALARTIVALADTLQLRTVAEGVEDAEQHAVLQALGCAHGQGFLFAHPLGSEELTELIAGRREGERAV